MFADVKTLIGLEQMLENYRQLNLADMYTECFFWREELFFLIIIIIF